MTKTALLRPTPSTPLDFTFTPAGCGAFTTDLILTSHDDVRVFRIMVCDINSFLLISNFSSGRGQRWEAN
jgi:hypothetical protein